MNKDQIKGKAKDLAGKVQEQAGRAVGNESQQAKGLAKQAAGKTQEGFGDAKETVRKATSPKGH
ncbi:uncharacterized protein YjbJ (UPF0337 family) [Paucimonas lemoignei]|uniref:Uncharacterized protein YjbJ (UPF0337 family) n=1 Tax=Paucimonas lemoignei TaxID=29443 RepID=A0A4R3HUX4_PAULE|nr:CsbD family protein [Paucimonas lemoignei]TCS35991.1 uncharacterized protein YjbJ (UPF0337 family) [Paucimonas lemoignei]